jgi:hypothetical protein
MLRHQGEDKVRLSLCLSLFNKINKIHDIQYYRFFQMPKTNME